MTEEAPKAKMVRGYVLPLRVGIDPQDQPNAGRKIVAYRPPVPGLLFARSFTPKGGWLIFHEPSGYTLVDGLSKKETALHACLDMGEWQEVDWTASPDELLAIPDLRADLLEMARHYQEEDRLIEEQKQAAKATLKAREKQMETELRGVG